MFAEKHADRSAGRRARRWTRASPCSRRASRACRTSRCCSRVSPGTRSSRWRACAPRTTYGEASALLARVARWVETALAVDAERIAADERALAPGRLPTVSLNGHLETYRAHGALAANECPARRKRCGRRRTVTRLRAPEDSLRRGVLSAPIAGDVLIELMQNLLAQGRPGGCRGGRACGRCCARGGRTARPKRARARPIARPRFDPAAALVRAERPARSAFHRAGQGAGGCSRAACGVLARQLARGRSAGSRRPGWSTWRCGGASSARAWASVLDEIPDARAPGFWEPWDGR
jgi:hypothetical protein